MVAAQDEVNNNFGKQETIKIVSTESEFSNLETAWNGLADKINSNDIFLRYEWFLAAWQWLKQEKTSPYVILVFQQGILVGLLPLCLKKAKKYRITFKSLEFFSIPDTQSCELMVSPGYEEYVCEKIAQVFWENDEKWDVLQLDKIPNKKNQLNNLECMAGKIGRKYLISDGGNNPSVNLQDSWVNYYSRRSRRLKKGNNHIANKIKKTAKDVSMKYINSETIDSSSLDVLVQDVVKVSASSWKSKTGLTLDNPGPFEFINAITKSAYKNGWLSIWIMLIDNEPVAIEYQLDCGGNVSALRADVNKDYEELSPGTYLNWKMLESLFSENKNYYQMGPGSIDYKKRWAEEYPHLHKVTIYNKSPYGVVLGFLELVIKPVIKKLKGTRDLD